MCLAGSHLYVQGLAPRRVKGGGWGVQALNLHWIPPKERLRAEHEGQGKVSLDDFGLKGFDAEASGTAWEGVGILGLFPHVSILFQSTSTHIL